MKKGLVIGIVVAVILIIMAGIYFYAPKPVYNISNNNMVYVNNSINIQTPPASTPTNTQVNTASAAQTHNIDISNYAFSPATITINVGDTVVWTNSDYVGHKIASDSGSELASSLLVSGDGYSHTFTAAGTYDYHCIIHTSMKGTVVVQ